MVAMESAINILSRGGRTSFKTYKATPPAPKERTYTTVMINSESILFFSIGFSGAYDDKKEAACQ
jgi:hypothetical protein